MMPGVTGKMSVDTSDAIRGVKQFNQELSRPIGIIEQLEINIADLGVAINNATNPAQVKRLTAELQVNERAMAQYTGRGLKSLVQGQEGMRRALSSSTQALMGFMFLLSAFDTSGAMGETNKLKTSLLQGAQSAVGFTFALQTLGGAAARFATPVGIALGVLVALMSALRGSGEEAKVAAEYVKTLVDEVKKLTGGNLESLEKYYKGLGARRVEVSPAAGTGMPPQFWGLFPSTVLGISKAEEKVYQELKKVFDLQLQSNLAAAEAKGIVGVQAEEVLRIKNEMEEITKLQAEGHLKDLDGLNLADRKYLLEKRLKELTKSSLEEQDKAQAEQVKRDKEFWPRWRAMRKEQEEGWKKEFDDAGKAAVDKAQHEAKLAKEREETHKKEEDALKKEYQMSLDLNSSAMNLADTLAGAFERAGDTGASAFMQVLRVALQIARTVSMINFGEVGQTTGTLDILSAIFGLGFAKGGYTGNLPRHRVAGVVHGGEMVFEKPIVDIYKNELLALRSSLQGGRSVAGYAGGGFVGEAGKGIRMYGTVDMLNGEIKLRQWMPGYEKFRKMKVR